MKKMKLSFFIILFILNSLGLYSQKWCAPGAEWYYFYADDFERGGYWHIYPHGDTVIINKACKVLKSEIIHRDNTISIMPDINTYISNDTVYYYNRGRFYILYRFDAIQGDSWQTHVPCEIYGLDISNCLPDTMISFTVDSVKPMIIDGSSYQVFYTHSSDGAWSLYSYTTRIGSLGFMFPNSTWLDPPVVGGLRCYNDSSGFYYNNSNMPCDTVFSAIKEIFYRKIQIYPNPSSDILYINSNEKIISIKIYNSISQLVFFENNVNNKDFSIITKSLLSGFYTIQISYSIKNEKNENTDQKVFKVIKL